jgi:hypothetical protein
MSDRKKEWIASSLLRRGRGIMRRQSVAKWLRCRPLIFAVPRGVYFSLGHSHMVSMAHWQKSTYTREPTRTKAELRQVLAEAVSNTQPSADHGAERLPKAKKIAARAAYVE